MGIRGLNKFLNDKFTFQKVNLKEFKALVIDGNNICHKLYQNEEINWTLGGEYQEFSIKVHTFFSGICNAGVTPIVVMDGLREVTKIDETCKRRKDTNSMLKEWQECGELVKNTIILPTLTLQTFMSVANELGIELIVSAGEGDQLVAAISNYTLSCPVLASDSDYFMFDLRNGYIPYQHFSYSECSLYHLDELKAQFHLQDTQMRLFIPAIHGNDFIPSLVEGYQDHGKTLSKLREYTSSEEYLADGSSLHNKYESAKKQYCNNVSPTKLIESSLSDTPQLSIKRSNTIDFHFCLLRITKTAVNVLSNAVEKISRESVWQCSQYIRQYIYGILGISNVYEIIRKQGSADLTKIKIESKYLIPPIAKTDVLQMETHKQEDIVLAVLKCNKMPVKYREALSKLPNEWKLFVATVFYWYITSSFATKHLVKALILCTKNVIATVPRQKQDSLDNIHAFGQWQSIYSNATALNSIAGSPFQVSSTAPFFSGKKVLYYATWESEHLTLNIVGDLLNMFEIATCKGKGKGHQTKELKLAACAPTHGNHFAVLSDVTD